MRTLIVWCALMAGVLTGCASVPMAAVEADTSAKQFHTKTGYSNIYLFRNETIGAAITMPVSLDGKIMGKTGPQTYFFWQVKPGKHEIASHTENTSKIIIFAKEGHNHYIWQEVKMGLWQPRSELQEVDEEKGRQGVRECKLAKDES